MALSQTEIRLSRLCVFPPDRINLTAQLFSCFGHDMHYLIGPQVEGTRTNDHIDHKNYFINLDDLKLALEQLTS